MLQSWIHIVICSKTQLRTISSAILSDEQKMYVCMYIERTGLAYGWRAPVSFIPSYIYTQTTLMHPLVRYIYVSLFEPTALLYRNKQAILCARASISASVKSFSGSLHSLSIYVCFAFFRFEWHCERESLTLGIFRLDVRTSNYNGLLIMCYALILFFFLMTMMSQYCADENHSVQ